MGRACGLGLEAHTATPTSLASAACPAHPLRPWETERVCDWLSVSTEPSRCCFQSEETYLEVPGSPLSHQGHTSCW